MADDLEIVGRIRITDDGTAVLERFNSQLGKTESAVGGVHGKMNLLSGAANMLHTAFSVAFGGIIQNLIMGVQQKVSEFFSSSIAEAEKFQNVQTQTNAVLKSTGGVAGVTADEVNNLAESLSHVTKYSEADVMSGENLLLTFTNIRDKFPEATSVMLDMSQALGQDLKSSAIQLGKALQDPILGVTALRRVGVNFNEESKKTIEQLVKSGQLEKAQAFILKELQTEFGGSAKAAGQTFAGQMAILNNRMDEAKEKIGEGLMPVLQMLAGVFIDQIVPIIETFAANFKTAMDTLTTSSATGEIRKLKDDLYLVGQVIKAVFGGDMTAAGNYLDLLFKRLGIGGPLLGSLGASLKNVASAFTESLPMIKHYVDDGIQFVMDTVKLVAPMLVQTISSTLDTISTFWTAHGREVMAIVDFLFKGLVLLVSLALETITGNIQVVTTGITGVWAIFSDALKGNWSGAWQDIQNVQKSVGDAVEQNERNLMNTILSVAGTNLDEFTAVWQKNGEMVWAIVTKLASDVGAAISKFFTDFVTAAVLGWKDFSTLWVDNGKNLVLIADTLISNVLAKIKGFVTNFRGMGLALMDSLKDGIFAKAAEIAEAAATAVRNIIQKAKDAIGWHSPIPVMVEMGNAMMTSLASGLQGAADIPMRQMGSSMSQVVGGATNTNNSRIQNNYFSWNGKQAERPSWMTSGDMEKLNAMASSV